MTSPRLITPVILSGGSGSRLWPLSRQDYPKQLLALLSDKTLLQETALRFRDKSRYSDPLVICNEAHRFAIAEQLQTLGINATIMLEPEGKNTAPAAALACYQALEQTTDALLLLVASDHVIQAEEAFHKAVAEGCMAADQGHIVSIGVAPETPETGYGYIRQGKKPLKGSEATYPIDSFVEKPDLETAEKYLKSGDYLWNASLFLFSAHTYLDELGRHNPAMLSQCKKAFESRRTDLDFIRLDPSIFAEIIDDSIDYAIMEKTDKAAVVPARSMGWSDIGSWQGLAEITPNDKHGNTVQHGQVFLEKTKNCFFWGSDHQVVGAIGLEDIVVVSTRDALLVAHKDESQRVKSLVEQLKQANLPQAVSQALVYRPWGSFECLDKGYRYQVKRLVVKPGEQLSLQKHHHRSEHWVVVQGTALVTKGPEQLILKENESAYLPLGTVHRLENPGKIPLVLIEVQSGSYLEEDDIVRLDDTYGRSEHPHDS